MNKEGVFNNGLSTVVHEYRPEFVIFAYRDGP